MKNLIIVLFFLFSSSSGLFGQNNINWVQGEISYVTKKNIYVKFNETKYINVGDSLFIKSSNSFVPVLLIAKKSSVSILCSSLDGDTQLAKGQVVYAKHKESNINKKDIKIKEKLNSIDPKQHLTNKEENNKIKLLPKIRGRFTIATSSNIAQLKEKTGNHRMRYIFSMKGENLINSNFYFDHYISFNQTYNPDFTLSETVNDKLRFYRVTFGYRGNGYDISVGRQIKNKISALGSFDGIYLEKKIKNDFYSGIVTGTRPDYTNYGFNTKLFQYGAFVSYFPDYKKSSTRGTIAFFEQKNSGLTDRRFLYAQFSTNFGKKIRFFGASEIDLFQIKDGISSNSPKLTSIYGNLSYRLSRKINLSLGFDSRKNRIYYETYKDFLETLIERETRQGLRFRFGYRPFKKVSFSLMSNLRFKDKELSSKYYNAMIFLRSIPLIKSSISISANVINTDYLESKSLSIRLSKRIKKRINLRLEYKYYQYFYPGTKSSRNQNRVGGSLNFNVFKRLYLSIYYEKTLQKERNFSRLNLRITKRF